MTKERETRDIVTLTLFEASPAQYIKASEPHRALGFLHGCNCDGARAHEDVTFGKKAYCPIVID